MARIQFTNETKGEGKFILPPGEYDAKLLSYEFGVSAGAKTSGCENVSLKFEAGGCWIFDTLIFAPTTAGFVSAFLRAWGFEAREGEDVEVDARMLDRLIGQTGRVKVRTDRFDKRDGSTKVSNKIAAYIGGAAQAPSKDPLNEDLSFDESSVPF